MSDNTSLQESVLYRVRYDLSDKERPTEFETRELDWLLAGSPSFREEVIYLVAKHAYSRGLTTEIPSPTVFDSERGARSTEQQTIEDVARAMGIDTVAIESKDQTWLIKIGYPDLLDGV